MPNALILYTNGKHEVKHLNDIYEYQTIVDGYFTMLPVSRGYVNPEDTETKGVLSRPRLVCYANEEGRTRKMNINPHGGVLSLLGVFLEEMGATAFGNVIVFSDSDDGEDKDIDPYIVSLFDQYEACEDENKFYASLLAINK